MKSREINALFKLCSVTIKIGHFPSQYNHNLTKKISILKRLHNYNSYLSYFQNLAHKLQLKDICYLTFSVKEPLIP